jgi:uncharacterized protein YcfJ
MKFLELMETTMNIKYLVFVLLALGTPILADQTTATIEDIYIDRIFVEPIVEKTCQEVDITIIGQSNGTNSANVLMGMIVGGILGKGITGKDNGAAAGAVMGGVIAADSKSKKAPQGYKRELRCGNYETTREVTKRIYSYSIITFKENGRKYSVEFIK